MGRDIFVSYSQPDRGCAFELTHHLGHAARVPSEELRKLETRLARIVGPIAGILVARAAAVAGDVAELERRLSAELDSPEDQRRFLQARS